MASTLTTQSPPVSDHKPHVQPSHQTDGCFYSEGQLSPEAMSEGVKRLKPLLLRKVHSLVVALGLYTSELRL